MTKRSLALPLFLTGEALSMFGNAAMSIVLPWLVLSRTGEASIAGLVAAAAALPAIVAAIGGGWLVDKVGPRPMSVLADLGSAASVAALAVVDRGFGLDIGWFIVLGIAGALFDGPGMTARDTLSGRVCRTSGVALDTLVGIRQAVFGVAFLGGPALAGVLLAVLDPIRVVWVTAVCSALAALSTAALRLLPTAPDEGGSEAEVGGWQTIRNSPSLRAMLLIGFGAALVTAPIIAVLLPAHFRLLGHPDWYGYTMSGFAVGALVGSGLYAVIARRSRQRAWVGGLVLLSLGMLAFAVLDGFWIVFIGTVLLGLGSGLLTPIFLVLITEQVREAVRGRVLGLLDAANLVATPLGLAGLAWLLTAVSLRTAAAAVVVVWLAVAAYSLTSPTMRTFVQSTPRPDKEVADAEHQSVG